MQFPSYFQSLDHTAVHCTVDAQRFLVYGAMPASDFFVSYIVSKICEPLLYLLFLFELHTDEWV